MPNFQIREIDRTDLPLIFKWRNSERIKKSMSTDGAITWEEHIHWYQRVSQEPSRKVFIFLQEEKPLGLVQFYNMDKKHERCHWGFYIGEEESPKGSGTKMGRLAINYIFQQGFRKICAEVIETNTTSLNFHYKLGFQLEGIYRNHIRKKGEWYNVFTMALFKEDWK